MKFSYEYFDKLYFCNPKSGKLYNRKTNKETVGKLNSDGYFVINIKKSFLKHRILWLLYTGDWPKLQIDHINGNRTDNRIYNLRDVTKRVNSQNLNCHRNGKLIGARLQKRTNKWESQIKIENKIVYLGTFKTQKQAHKAYMKKLKEVKNG